MNDPCCHCCSQELAGLVLGAIFFGGLWWTVRKGLSSQQPALWFLGSMLLRMGDRARRLLLCRSRRLAAACWPVCSDSLSRVSS